MITKVINKKQLHDFIYYIKELYHDDPNYIYPIFSSLKKELNKEVLKTNHYTALLAYNEENNIVGRIMYTISDNKQLHEQVCFFSFFDVINNIKVAKELFTYLINDIKKQNIRYVEGTYSPYDPDTRRGILAKGFDERPMLFTSYNYEYYNDLLLECGFSKAYDTISVKVNLESLDFDKLKRYQTFFLSHNKIVIDNLSWTHINRDLNDVKKIFDLATTEINYQLPPNINIIKGFIKSFGFFINKDLVKIARDEKTKEPVGFCLVLPDYNQIFQRTKGRILPLTLLRNKHKITAARGILQYIIPKYQSSGLIGCMFFNVYESFKKLGIKDFEGGTIMENNQNSINVLKRFNGDINKIYRIYRKDI